MHAHPLPACTGLGATGEAGFAENEAVLAGLRGRRHGGRPTSCHMGFVPMYVPPALVSVGFNKRVLSGVGARRTCPCSGAAAAAKRGATHGGEGDCQHAPVFVLVQDDVAHVEGVHREQEDDRLVHVADVVACGRWAGCLGQSCRVKGVHRGRKDDRLVKNGEC